MSTDALTSSLPSPVAARTAVALARFALSPAMLAAPLSNSLLFSASISDLHHTQCSPIYHCVSRCGADLCADRMLQPTTHRVMQARVEGSGPIFRKQCAVASSVQGISHGKVKGS